MSKRLLVTDDALIIREMIKDTAIAHGWEIVGEAANGYEAIERYRELQPDTVTLDLVMPECDGLQALRGIMAHDPAARVLVVSALDQKSILNEALELGAYDFVVKPFAATRLANALNKMLARASA